MAEGMAYVSWSCFEVILLHYSEWDAALDSIVNIFHLGEYSRPPCFVRILYKRHVYIY